MCITHAVELLVDQRRKVEVSSHIVHIKPYCGQHYFHYATHEVFDVLYFNESCKYCYRLMLMISFLLVDYMVLSNCKNVTCNHSIHSNVHMANLIMYVFLFSVLMHVRVLGKINYINLTSLQDHSIYLIDCV